MKYALPTPLRVSKLVRSKLKNSNKRAPGNFKLGRQLCQNYDVISLENEFTNRHKSKTCKVNFDFECKIQCVIYLITYKVCRKQYVGSTITLLRK